jgi:hypothetical protein
MKTWQIVLVVVATLVGGGYLVRDSIVRILDAHFYEPTLTVCVASTRLLAPERLDIELRSFCNVSMITLVANLDVQDAQASD